MIMEYLFRIVYIGRKKINHVLSIDVMMRARARFYIWLWNIQAFDLSFSGGNMKILEASVI